MRRIPSANRFAFGRTKAFVPPHFSVIRVVILLTLLLVLSACGRKTGPDFPDPETLPALQARVSTHTPRVGDIIEVSLRITSDARPVLPPWSELLHEAVHLLDHRTPAAVQDEDGLWRQEATLRIALYALKPVTLFSDDSVQTRNDPPQTLPLPFIALTVEALTDESDLPSFGDMSLMDFRGPEALRRARRNRWISLAGLLLLSVLIYGIYRHLKHRPAPPPPPPQWDRIALRKMETLRTEPIWVQADADASAVALCDILREYIEGRFAIHAPDLTTEEFLLEASERQPWSDREQQELESFFRETDRIKFAAQRPGAGALTGLMEAAERFVRITGEGGTA